MDIKKDSLSTLTESSDFYLAKPSDYARNYYYYLVGIGNFYCNAEYAESRKSGEYESILIMYVKSGALRFESGTAAFTARAGETVVLDCYGGHCYRALEPSNFSYVHFDGSNSRELCATLAGVSRCELQTFEKHTGILSGIIGAFNDNAAVSESEVSVLLHTVLCDLSAHLAVNYNNKLSGDAGKALRYIKNNYDKPLSLKAIAARLSVSAQHLNRLFKAELNTSIYNFLLDYRLAVAKKLLLSTDYPVSRIADNIGYSSAINFINKFKVKYGVSPGIYRKINQNS